MRVRAMIVALTTALSLTLSMPAAADSGRLLGSTRLTHAEHDIDVLKIPCRPKVHEIRLRALRGQVEIEQLWVRYGNGRTDRLSVATRLPEGAQTRWIDLRGGRRCVVEIGVIGDTERSVDQARLEIYGR